MIPGSVCLRDPEQLSSLKLFHLLRLDHRAVYGVLLYSIISVPLPGWLSLPLSKISLPSLFLGGGG